MRGEGYQTRDEWYDVASTFIEFELLGWWLCINFPSYIDTILMNGNINYLIFIFEYPPFFMFILLTPIIIRTQVGDCILSHFNSTLSFLYPLFVFSIIIIVHPNHNYGSETFGKWQASHQLNLYCKLWQSRIIDFGRMIIWHLL